MVYLVAALAQFCVLLLTQMAIAAGWIVASSALLIGFVVAIVMVLHAVIHHYRSLKRRPPTP